jgi:hypothetical protein
MCFPRLCALSLFAFPLAALLEHTPTLRNVTWRYLEPGPLAPGALPAPRPRAPSAAGQARDVLNPRDETLTGTESQDTMAEWLRRQIRIPTRYLFPYGSAGSNPAGVVFLGVSSPITCIVCTVLYIQRFAFFLHEHKRSISSREALCQTDYMFRLRWNLCLHTSWRRWLTTGHSALPRPTHRSRQIIGYAIFSL